MSATNRGLPRQLGDFYPTPEWATRAFLKAPHNIPFLGGWVWEPCAGDGAIIRAAKKHYPESKWIASDIREDFRPYLKNTADQVMMGDFLKFRANHVEVIMTNPPFCLAEPMIENALANAQYVVMLLRLNFLGAQKRAGFFRDHAPDVYVLPRRPSFGKNKDGRKGNDATEYAWFVWGPQRFRRRGLLQVLDPEDCV